MNIGFFIGEMNLRGVANSSYQYAYYNERLLKNKSLIFYNKEEKFHKKEVISKFKKKIISLYFHNFFPHTTARGDIRTFGYRLIQVLSKRMLWFGFCCNLQTLFFLLSF